MIVIESLMLVIAATLPKFAYQCFQKASKCNGAHLCPDRLGLFVVKEGALVTYIRLGMMQAEWAAKWYPVKRRTTVASAS